MITIPAEQIGRQHLGKAVSFQLPSGDDHWVEIAGTLMEFSHANDLVGLAVQEADEATESWELDLNHEVTIR